MDKMKGVIALISLGLIVTGAIGYGIGLAEAEKRQREVWLAQPAYEYYKLLQAWDVYGVNLDDTTIKILWYNATDWGIGTWERDDPFFLVEKGNGTTMVDWFALQARDVFIHYNNGKDVFKGTYWVLVI